MAKTNITSIPDSELRGAYESLALENGMLKARANRYEKLYKDSVLATCRRMWEGKAITKKVSGDSCEKDYVLINHIEEAVINDALGTIKLTATVMVLTEARPCGFEFTQPRRIIQDNRLMEIDLTLDYKLKDFSTILVSDEEFDKELKRILRIESALKDPRGQLITKGCTVAYNDTCGRLTCGTVEGFNEISVTFDIRESKDTGWCGVEVKAPGDILVISQ